MGRLSCHRLVVELAAPLLEQAMPIGGGALPDVVLGWRDSCGRIRRVRADYPNGWRLDLRVNTRGEITSHHGSIRLRGKVRGRA